MTEWEKMVNGERYLSSEPEIMRRRNAGRLLCARINALDPDDFEGRAALLRQAFGGCGERLWLLQPFYFTYGCNIFIGDNSFINMNCTFLDSGLITIGDRCLIGPDVKIYTSSHPTTPERHWADENGTLHITNFALPVTIGNNVWIGGGAILCPGVTIGDDCVIGAGSVVTRSLPAGVLAAGNPCTVKRNVR